MKEELIHKNYKKLVILMLVDMEESQILKRILLRNQQQSPSTKKILTTFAQYQVLYYQYGEAHSSGEGGSKTEAQLVVKIQVSLLNRGHK